MGKTYRSQKNDQPKSKSNTQNKKVKTSKSKPQKNNKFDDLDLED
jgi:hypothetical protein